MTTNDGEMICPLCCPPAGHANSETPYWLGTSGWMPAHWRFIYHIVCPLPYRDGREVTELTRLEKIDAARVYAQVYGDRALLRAIREARTLPRRHGQPPWDGLWDQIVRGLHEKARVA